MVDHTAIEPKAGHNQQNDGQKYDESVAQYSHSNHPHTGIDIVSLLTEV